MVSLNNIATEAALKASGLAYTLLRNGWYTENYTGSLAASIEHGALIGASGEGRIASAARADYAEALAASPQNEATLSIASQSSRMSRWRMRIG